METKVDPECCGGVTMLGWNSPARAKRRVAFGLLLIAVGVFMALDRLGWLGLGDYGRWWPVLVIAYGVTRMVIPTWPGDIGRGLGWSLVGLWLLGVQLGWHGLTYRNSWPLLLVAFGVGMVTRGLLGARPRPDDTGGAQP